MKDKVTELLKQALKLPEEARAALAGSLLDTLDQDEDESAALEWEQEIARRVKELDSGAVRTVPWSEVRKRLESRIRDAER